MKRLPLIILLLCVLPVLSLAQELNRQVEVTKSYTPEPRSAAKLSLPPQMEDSVPMRPEEHYEIISAQWQTDFGMADKRFPGDGVVTGYSEAEEGEDGGAHRLDVKG